MLRDFVFELVAAPANGLTISLPGSAPGGRITWAAGFVAPQTVFYVLDDSVQEEWGVGQLTIGFPSTITRALVLGNSAGSTARLTFNGTTRCYSSLPASAVMSILGSAMARNLFHNSMDRIAQRGAGAFTTAGYTADRWIANIGTGGGSRSITVISLSDADRTAIGDMEADKALRY